MKTSLLNNVFLLCLLQVIAFHIQAAENNIESKNTTLALNDQEQPNSFLESEQQQIKKQIKKITNKKKAKKIKKNPGYFTRLKNEAEFSHRIEWVIQASQMDPAYSDLDPDNSRYLQTTSSTTSQFNIELKLNLFNSTSFIDRSHAFIYTFDQLTVINKIREHHFTKELRVYHSEAFIRQILSDQFNAEIGLINFQWGPAEFATPSNPLFSINPNKSLLANIDHGRYLTKLNWTPVANWNFILLYEFKNNPVIETIANDEKFKRSALAKIEYSSEENSNHYLGFSFYQKESLKLKSGIYGQWQISDEWSTYMDLVSIPKSNDSTEENTTDVNNSTKDSIFGIFGIRHSGDWDKRIELIQNSAGLNKQELSDLYSTIILAQNAFNMDFSNLFKAGQPLYGKDYLYLSLRIPDFLNFQDVQFYLRDLISLQDQSSQMQSSIEFNLGDSTIGNIQWQYNLGEDNSEFMLLRSQALHLAIKTVW